MLLDGAQACNVWWQVGSSATLGTGSTLRGNILALTSITLTTGATVEGRALARNGAVTLDTNTITRPGCSPATTAASPTPGTTPGAGGTTGPGGGGATGSGASNRGRLPVTGAPIWTAFAFVIGAALILAGAFVNLLADRRQAVVLRRSVANRAHTRD